MPKKRKPVCIAGVAESDLGNCPHHTVLSMQAQAAHAALADAGLEKDQIDGLLCAYTSPRFDPSMTMQEYLGLRNLRWSDSTNIGGSSFELHVNHAWAAIEAGVAETVLITYGSTQKSQQTRGAPRPQFQELTNQFEAPYGMPTPVGAYAMAAMRHMYQYGTTKEQLAEIAVATRKWASLNPKAYFRDPITVEDVVKSRPIADPLNLLDCCLVTDGGGAVIVTSEERAKQLRKPPVYVLGAGEAHWNSIISQMPDVTVTCAQASGQMAMQEAGVRHKDFDIVEIYDSFTITVLLTLEALGFCKPGQGGAFVSGQRTAPGGEFPLNTNGGGLSYCHPGMYGIFIIIEAVRQLRGECGERQVKDAGLALVHGTGGVLSSGSTLVLGRG